MQSGMEQTNMIILFYKVHGRAQCFVLGSYTINDYKTETFPLVCSSSSSKVL